MKKLTLVAIAILLPFATARAADPGTEQGCTPSGTWVGTFEGTPVMTITYGHESAQSGTLVIDLPSFDPALGHPLQLAGVKASSAARGIWRKTGGNTWYFKALIIGSVPGGGPVYWATIYGPVVARNKCTSISIQTWMDVKFANGETSVGNYLGEHGGFPMTVQLP